MKQHTKNKLQKTLANLLVLLHIKIKKNFLIFTIFFPIRVETLTLRTLVVMRSIFCIYKKKLDAGT